MPWALYIYFLEWHWLSHGQIILLVGVAFQAGAIDFAMVVVGRIIAGAETAMWAVLISHCYSLITYPHQNQYQPRRILSRNIFSSDPWTSCVLCSIVISDLGFDCVLCWSRNSENSRRALVESCDCLASHSGHHPDSRFLRYLKSPRWMWETHPAQKYLVLKPLSKIHCLPENDEVVQQEYLELVAALQYRLENEGAFTWRELLSKYSIWRRIGFRMAKMALG